MNVNGSLKSILYGKPYVKEYKKIENFSLYHILPGQSTLSLGVAGNNLKILNAKKDIPEETAPESVKNMEESATQIAKEAKKTKTKIITYNYAEPTVYYEYLKEIAKKSKELKHVIVTNGFINYDPLIEICYLIDGANIELKSMEDSFYKSFYEGKLEPILKAIKTMRERDIWVEISMWIIPEIHDNLYEVRKLISWILDNLGSDTPLHLTKYNEKTDPELLKKARRIAMQAGMNYVYTEIPDWLEGNTTFCPNCKKPVIIRLKENIENKLKNGKCGCGMNIPGIWE
jgi:pyruvate formate lyase activating enzyme